MPWYKTRLYYKTLYNKIHTMLTGGTITTTNKGTRVLHAKDPDAKANLKCKLRYKKIIGDKNINISI